MDWRTGRTEARLIEATRSLMRARAWNLVSVSAICDAANVSRSTFYEHYADREDLLDAVFAALHDRLSERVTGRGLTSHGTFVFLPALVSHLRGHLPLVERGDANPANLALLVRFRAVVGAVMREELGKAGRTDVVRSLRHVFMLGGVFGMLERWCDDGCRRDEAAVLSELDTLVGLVLDGHIKPLATM